VRPLFDPVKDELAFVIVMATHSFS